MANEESFGDYVHVTAQSIETVAAGHPLSFPAPYAERSGSPRFQYTWELIQFVFELPTPSDFPPLHTFGSNDYRVLRRYLSAAEELAQSAFLRHPLQLRVNLTGDVNDVIASKDFPPKENVRGFSILFRQFYANGEPASFNSVQRVLRKASTSAADGSVETRTEMLTAWAKAVGRLRGYQLKVLAGRKVMRQGVGIIRIFYREKRSARRRS